MDLSALGRVTILIGFTLVVLGVVLLGLSRIPGLKQLGRLPGDIRLENGNFSCFFPLASMLILSILLSVALSLLLRFLNR